MIDYLELASRAVERFQVPGELVPLRELERRSVEPAEASATRGGTEVWISWCYWKAHELNRLFREQGLTGQPGRITAETVRHGEHNHESIDKRRA